MPLFSGAPSDYREWRKRITLYMTKMKLLKRETEGVLNLISSLSGTAWKVVEAFPLEDVEKGDAFNRLMKLLDKAFEYDNRVQLPGDFDKYFSGFQRHSGQTLLDYCTLYDELYNRLADHKVTLPNQVQGWHLLRRAGLTREQRQLVLTQAPSLEKNKVQETLFLVLGQDFKTVAGHSKGGHRGKGRGYAAFYGDDEADAGQWDESYDYDAEDYSAHYEYDEYYTEHNDSPSHYESPSHHGYYEEDTAGFDDNAAYYGDEAPPEDPQEQAEEYDSAFAAYLDARKRFNDIKLARGYLPIVALSEAGAGLSPGISPSASPSSSPGRGKGKGKPKGKNKGKGGRTTVKYPPRGPGKADPRGRARAALASMTCLRCGQQGHTTYNSPVPKGSPKKRSAPTESVVGDEHGLVIFLDDRGHERPDCSMLDPGASAFLSGYGPFKRYVEKLREMDFDITQLEFMRCSRTFHFGGDASSQCQWTVKLPMFLAGQFGYVQMYLLKGETPMLMGRPIMEQLGLVLDCGRRCIKLGDMDWQPTVIGAHGEYLLPLLDDYDLAWLAHPPAFELIAPADTEANTTSFKEFNNMENLFEMAPTECASNEGMRPMQRHLLDTCDVHLNELENSLHAYVTNELHNSGDRPRVLWEVYCGEARVAKIAESMGMTVECFGPNTGWDFDDPEHQRAFLERQRDEMPDEVYISPDCRLWSEMQNLAARTESQQLELYNKRARHHKVHVKFVAQIYMEQVDNSRHAHIEQPELARSWKTTALKDLPGYFTIFHQCMFGSCCLNPVGSWELVKKATALLTSKVTMSVAMNRLCDGQHNHCALEGSASGIGRRTSYMENYQPSLAATLASAIYAPDPPQLWEHAMAVPEQKEVTGRLIQLQTNLKAEAVRTVQRLHRNLGHPSPESLVELLQSRGASDAVVEAARSYKCVACLRYKKPNNPSPATLRQRATELGECVQADVLWLKIGDNKFPVLSVVDTATKYQMASLLKSERGPDLIKGLERCWIKHFGIPTKLVTDEGRGWCGTEFSEWTTDFGVQHEVAPGGAHTRLSAVERRHSVLRKAAEIFMTDRNLDNTTGVRMALTYVLPQINSSTTVAGFSPMQWVLGKQVTLPGELCGERLSPGQLDGYNFENVLKNRTAAKTALALAEEDSKLRRALLRQYQGTNFPIEVGQLCHFWRDQREDKLTKIRWHGPARVVMREDDDQGAPHTYWLAWKTQLLRCAPHHVRADLTSMANQIEDAKEAKKAVAGLRSRGVTRFLDLERINKHNLDDLDDDEMSDGAGDDDDDLQPPRQRRRLDGPALSVQGLPALPGLGDPDGGPRTPGYSPGTPVDENAPTEVVPSDDDAILVDQDAAAHLPVPEPDELEPGQEPSVPPTPALAAASRPALTLDPETAALYEPAPDETFNQMRRRFDAQESSLFGPMRRRHRLPAPYEEPHRAPRSSQPLQPAEPSLPQQPTEEQALFNHAFTVTDLDATELPQGWHVDEQGYIQLDLSKMEDYWEVKSGCLIRHHLRPRRLLHEFAPGPDCPVTADMLDPIRVTMMRLPNGTTNVMTNNINTREKPMPTTWTGITVYQLTGKVRKEQAMMATAMPAKKVARQYKHMTAKKIGKKPAELSERNMSLWEKEQFMAAKAKELKSFFEHGVWEFSTEKEADPTRTLSSRMLLKWSRNPDGSPRAKARLIVRGYADRDALEGRVETSAPTTSRLSRSMFLSLSSCLKWSGWTADVSTAFLQGVPQQRRLWVKLPADALAILGCEPDVRMFLHKPIYGQLDAPRRWVFAGFTPTTWFGFQSTPS